MKKFILITLILIFSTTNYVFASNVYIEKSQEDIKVGDEVLINLQLDTENAFYNAIQGKISVSNNLEIKQVVTGSSIISAWIENPSKSKSNEIEFSGIIAGGYKGTGTIFGLIIIPKDKSVSKIQAKDISLFLNDGQGTEINKENYSIEILARNLKANESNSKIETKDTRPPIPFEVILTQDKNIDNGKYILIFETQDKDSGIKTYQVLEGKKLFEQAESPYVLKNQKINERIYVKAIDYENNERVSKVSIPGKTCIGIKCIDQKFIIILIALIFVLSFIIWNKQSKELKRIEKNSL